MVRRRPAPAKRTRDDAPSMMTDPPESETGGSTDAASGNEPVDLENAEQNRSRCSSKKGMPATSSRAAPKATAVSRKSSRIAAATGRTDDQPESLVDVAVTDKNNQKRSATSDPHHEPAKRSRLRQSFTNDILASESSTTEDGPSIPQHDPCSTDPDRDDHDITERAISTVDEPSPVGNVPISAGNEPGTDGLSTEEHASNTAVSELTGAKEHAPTTVGAITRDDDTHITANDSSESSAPDKEPRSEDTTTTSGSDLSTQENGSSSIRNGPNITGEEPSNTGGGESSTHGEVTNDVSTADENNPRATGDKSGTAGDGSGPSTTEGESEECKVADATGSTAMLDDPSDDLIIIAVDPPSSKKVPLAVIDLDSSDDENPAPLSQPTKQLSNSVGPSAANSSQPWLPLLNVVQRPTYMPEQLFSFQKRPVLPQFPRGTRIPFDVRLRKMNAEFDRYIATVDRLNVAPSLQERRNRLPHEFRNFSKYLDNLICIKQEGPLPIPLKRLETIRAKYDEYMSTYEKKMDLQMTNTTITESSVRRLHEFRNFEDYYWSLVSLGQEKGPPSLNNTRQIAKAMTQPRVQPPTVVSNNASQNAVATSNIPQNASATPRPLNAEPQTAIVTQKSNVNPNVNQNIRNSQSQCYQPFSKLPQQGISHSLSPWLPLLGVTHRPRPSDYFVHRSSFQVRPVLPQYPVDTRCPNERNINNLRTEFNLFIRTIDNLRWPPNIEMPTNIEPQELRNFDLYFRYLVLTGKETVTREQKEILDNFRFPVSTPRIKQLRREYTQHIAKHEANMLHEPSVTSIPGEVRRPNEFRKFEDYYWYLVSIGKEKGPPVVVNTQKPAVPQNANASRNSNPNQNMNAEPNAPQSTITPQAVNQNINTVPAPKNLSICYQPWPTVPQQNILCPPSSSLPVSVESSETQPWLPLLNVLHPPNPSDHFVHSYYFMPSFPARGKIPSNPRIAQLSKEFITLTKTIDILPGPPNVPISTTRKPHEFRNFPMYIRYLVCFVSTKEIVSPEHKEMLKSGQLPGRSRMWSSPGMKQLRREYVEYMSTYKELMPLNVSCLTEQVRRPHEFRTFNDYYWYLVSIGKEEAPPVLDNILKPTDPHNQSSVPHIENASICTTSIQDMPQTTISISQIIEAAPEPNNSQNVAAVQDKNSDQTVNASRSSATSPQNVIDAPQMTISMSQIPEAAPEPNESVNTTSVQGKNTGQTVNTSQESSITAHAVSVEKAQQSDNEAVQARQWLPLLNIASQPKPTDQFELNFTFQDRPYLPQFPLGTEIPYDARLNEMKKQFIMLVSTTDRLTTFPAKSACKRRLPHEFRNLLMYHKYLVHSETEPGFPDGKSWFQSLQFRKEYNKYMSEYKNKVNQRALAATDVEDGVIRTPQEFRDFDDYYWYLVSIGKEEGPAILDNTLKLPDPQNVLATPQLDVPQNSNAATNPNPNQNLTAPQSTISPQTEKGPPNVNKKIRNAPAPKNQSLCYQPWPTSPQQNNSSLPASVESSESQPWLPLLNVLHPPNPSDHFVHSYSFMPSFPTSRNVPSTMRISQMREEFNTFTRAIDILPGPPNMPKSATRKPHEFRNFLMYFRDLVLQGKESVSPQNKELLKLGQVHENCKLWSAPQTRILRQEYFQYMSSYKSTPLELNVTRRTDQVRRPHEFRLFEDYYWYLVSIGKEEDPPSLVSASKSNTTVPQNVPKPKPNDSLNATTVQDKNAGSTSKESSIRAQAVSVDENQQSTNETVSPKPWLPLLNIARRPKPTDQFELGFTFQDRPHLPHFPLGTEIPYNVRLNEMKNQFIMLISVTDSLTTFPAKSACKTRLPHEFRNFLMYHKYLEHCGKELVLPDGKSRFQRIEFLKGEYKKYMFKYEKHVDQQASELIDVDDDIRMPHEFRNFDDYYWYLVSIGKEIGPTPKPTAVQNALTGSQPNVSHHTNTSIPNIVSPLINPSNTTVTINQSCSQNSIPVPKPSTHQNAIPEANAPPKANVAKTRPSVPTPNDSQRMDVDSSNVEAQAQPVARKLPGKNKYQVKIRQLVAKHKDEIASLNRENARLHRKIAHLQHLAKVARVIGHRQRLVREFEVRQNIELDQGKVVTQTVEVTNPDIEVIEIEQPEESFSQSAAPPTRQSSSIVMVPQTPRPPSPPPPPASSSNISKDDASLSDLTNDRTSRYSSSDVDPTPPRSRRRLSMDSISSSRSSHTYLDEDAPPPKNRLLVFCDKSFTRSHIVKHFGRYGIITSAYVVMDSDNWKSKGFAFINFDKTSDALKAFERLNGRCIASGTLPLRIEFTDDNPDVGKTDSIDKEKRRGLLRLLVVVQRETTTEQLQEEFSQFGEVSIVTVFHNRDLTETKTRACVRFKYKKGAVEALKRCNRRFCPVLATGDMQMTSTLHSGWLDEHYPRPSNQHDSLVRDSGESSSRTRSPEHIKKKRSRRRRRPSGSSTSIGIETEHGSQNRSRSPHPREKYYSPKRSIRSRSPGENHDRHRRQKRSSGTRSPHFDDREYGRTSQTRSSKYSDRDSRRRSTSHTRSPRNRERDSRRRSTSRTRSIQNRERELRRISRSRTRSPQNRERSHWRRISKNRSRSPQPHHSKDKLVSRSRLQSHDQLAKEKATTQFSCTVCDVKYSGKEIYLEHMQSKGHLRRVTDIETRDNQPSRSCEERPPSEEAENENVCCDYCENAEVCSSFEFTDWEQHYNDISNSPLFCNDCYTRYGSQKAYNDHLTSQRHLESRKRIEEAS